MKDKLRVKKKDKQKQTIDKYGKHSKRHVRIRESEISKNTNIKKHR